MKLRVVRTTSRDSHISVEDEVFNQPNEHLLAQAVKVYLSNQRQGTSKTQTRSEVNRTTRKWYAQKGTGNARHGAQDANIFVGGSIAHGPTGEENWKKNLSQSQKKKALAAALSAQIENIAVNDEVEELEGKTGPAYELLSKVLAKIDEKGQFDDYKVLLVVDEKDELMMRAIRNIPNLRVVRADLLNALAIAQADKIIMTNQALEIIQNRIVNE
jgi:large subunit ribosomal protein L4